jgi:hypothetical protein
MGVAHEEHSSCAKVCAAALFAAAALLRRAVKQEQVLGFNELHRLVAGQSVLKYQFAFQLCYLKPELITTSHVPVGSGHFRMIVVVLHLGLAKDISFPNVPPECFEKYISNMVAGTSNIEFDRNPLVTLVDDLLALAKAEAGPAANDLDGFDSRIVRYPST